MSFFSIIIPAYNRSELLKATLNSLLVQTFSDIEIIVIDDGGNDDTAAMIASLKDNRIRYEWKENGERGAARNYGAAMAQGKYINFFDSDDLALPHHLQSAFDFIKKHQPLAFHQAYAWSNTEGKITKELESFAEGDMHDVLMQRNPFSCNGVFLKKEIALEFPFETDRRCCFMEDYLVWLRIALQHPFWHNPVVTSLVVTHAQRTTTASGVQKLRDGLDCFLFHLRTLAKANAAFAQQQHRVVATALLQYAYSVSATGRYKMPALSAWAKAIAQHPGAALQTLSWVTIKNIVIRW